MLFCPALHLEFLPPGCVERWLCSDRALIQVSALLTAPKPLCFRTTWPINVSKLNWEYSIWINGTFLLVQYESALFSLQMFYLHWGCVSVCLSGSVCVCVCLHLPACVHTLQAEERPLKVTAAEFKPFVLRFPSFSQCPGGHGATFKYKILHVSLHTYLNVRPPCQMPACCFRVNSVSLSNRVIEASRRIE